MCIAQLQKHFSTAKFSFRSIANSIFSVGFFLFALTKPTTVVSLFTVVHAAKFKFDSLNAMAKFHVKDRHIYI